jgi:hypothetical protein
VAVPFSFWGVARMNYPADYELMRNIEQRFRTKTGIQSRDFYSIFYGPLKPSKFLMINANPGGTPENYKIVDVLAGEHEYIEGRNSGPTTRNGAEILQFIAATDDSEAIRGVQVLNRFFRRSPMRPDSATESKYVAEAKPYLQELINYIQPEAILFGGDASVAAFAKAHGGTVNGRTPIMGPNGSREAVYFRDYQLKLPYYRSVPAVGIYHPSKLNGHFRKVVFPLLRDRFGDLIRVDAK